MISYLINATIALASFLLLYYVLLQQETMYRFNRVYLLASIIFSLVIPLLQLKTKWVKAAPASVVPIDNMHVIPPMPVQEKAITVTPSIPQDTDWASMLFYVYVGVALIFAVRYVYNLITIILLASKNKVVNAGTFRYVLLNKEVTPFSFLKNIFVSSNAFAEGKIPQEILLHEEAHVDKRHSLDIIFIELLLCLLWFHPLIYLYRRVIKLNHELEADHAVLSHTHNVWGYKKIMISSLLQSYHIPIASSFNFYITKKRIAMMTKQSNSVVMLFKKTLTLPVLASLLFYCSTTVEKVAAQEPLRIKEVVMRDTAEPRIVEGVMEDTTPIRRKEVVMKVLGDTTKLTKTKVPETMDELLKLISKRDTVKGITDEQMQEYQEIINRYGIELNQQSYPQFLSVLKKDDYDRLRDLYFGMSLKQQIQQNIQFFKREEKYVKHVPSQIEFEKLKDSSIYDVYVDGNKVANNVLNKYSNTDFDYCSAVDDDLPSNLKITSKRTAQLMTPIIFKAFQKEINNESDFMCYVEIKLSKK